MKQKRHADGIPQDIVNVVLTILGDEAGYKWLHTQLGRFEGRKVRERSEAENGEKALKAFIMRIPV